MSGRVKTDGREGADAAESVTMATAAMDAGPILDRDVQAQIGDKLRSLYGELSAQPLPDRLVSIIERLGESPQR